jgi:L-amino acid N-acyltransferase YncA
MSLESTLRASERNLEYHERIGFMECGLCHQQEAFDRNTGEFLRPCPRQKNEKMGQA